MRKLTYIYEVVLLHNTHEIKSKQKAFFNLNIFNMSPNTEWFPAEW